MRIKNTQIIVFILFCLSSYFGWSGVKLNTETKKQIKKILEIGLKVYELDTMENSRIFGKIDNYFENISDSKEVIHKSTYYGRITCMKFEMKKNIPIFATQKMNQGMEIKKPLHVYYFKAPRFRSFIKTLSVPGSACLNKREVIQIGTDFILKNGFTRVSEHDRLTAHAVISRKRRLLVGNVEGKTIGTEANIVIFNRYFKGIPVVNSRQFVAIHPISKEILSYSTIDWIPVREMSKKEYKYVSEDVLFEKIKNISESTNNITSIVEVEPAMYQNDQFLIPILMAHSGKTYEDNQGAPLKYQRL